MNLKAKREKEKHKKCGMVMLFSINLSVYLSFLTICLWHISISLTIRLSRHHVTTISRGKDKERKSKAIVERDVVN